MTKIIPLTLMRGDSHYIGIIERKCYIKETQPEEPETEGETE